MFREDPDPEEERVEDDPNCCSVCGGAVANGVRIIHEEGGPLCLSCAVVMVPEQVKEAERMWRELTGTDPKSSE
jgi:hypothetical protein